MTRESEIETENIPRKRSSEPGLLVKIGNHKLTVPVTTIIVGALTALGTAYRVVAADRAEVISRIDTLEKADQAQCQKQELQQLVLVEIRTQLARIDARVAEVQVTLMRSGGR
jgi:Tfp pilus assembly protein PilO